MERLKQKSVFPVIGDLKNFPTPDDLNDEEKMIATMVSQFVDESILPQLESLENHDYDLTKELFTAAGELGLMGVEVPEEYGGLELGKKVSGLIAEKMGYAASFSVAFNIHSGVGLLPYVLYGTDEQKQKYVPKLASGEWIGAYALTEPNAGSDALAAKTSAKWEEDSKTWVLSGEKQWITNAHLANTYVVFAKGEEGITAFIVERDMPGVSVGPEEKKLGIKGSSTATLILDQVRLSNDHVLGTVGKGHYIALNILNLARLKLAFSNIGMAKQAMEIAIQYGLERKQFATKIVDFPIIQEKIANMAVAIYGVESMAYYTAHLLDEIDNNEKLVKELSNYMMDCAMNKVKASETLDYVVDESLQIHGGYGFMEEYDITRMYRDARINRIFEGTNEINRLTVAKALLNQYRKDSNVLKEVGKPTSRNEQFIHHAIQLIDKVVENLPEMDRKTMDDYQDYLRVISDMLTEVYQMKAALYRSLKDDQNQIKEMIADIICEEGFQLIEMQATTLIASIVKDEGKKAEMLASIKGTEIPIYTDLFAKKREISKKQVETGKYAV